MTEAIRQKGLTISGLSRTTGIPRTTLTRKVDHPDELTVRQLRAISRELGVSITSWFAGAA